MVGWMTWSQTLRGWRPSVEETQVEGFPLLRVDLPIPRHPKAEARQVLRGARRLARAGCRRVLAGPAFDHWAVLEDFGLRPVEAGRLSQAMAAPLILADLNQRGIPARRACAALRGTRLTRPCVQAAEILCRQVRQLIIAIPEEGAELAHYLRAEYGIAVLEGDRPADVTACFSPVDDHPEGLQLYGARPVLPGLSLTPPGPDCGIDPAALAALLWEEGWLKLEDIRIVPKTPAFAGQKGGDCIA